jgi:hypothetical protein
MLRTFTSGLVGLAIAGLIGVSASAGCSADGSGGELPTTGSNPTEPPGSKMPPPGDPTDGTDPGDDDDSSLPTDGGKKPDGGKKDASTPPPPPRPDAGLDAGPPPDEGASCTQVNKVFKRTCGLCGWQDAVCLQYPDGLKVSEYSPCREEVPNGCVPGTVEERPCGNCGVIRRQCDNYCRWPGTGPSTQCINEPVDSCVPGTVDYRPAGCPDGTFRSTTCKAVCEWEPASHDCAPPPSFVTVAPLATSNYTLAVLKDGQVSKRLNESTTCPTTLQTISTPYTYIEVRNPYSRVAMVSVKTVALATGSPTGTMLLAAYSGSQPPSTDAQRQACVRGVNSAAMPKLQGTTNSVAVPPRGSVMIYYAASTEFDQTNKFASTGMVRLEVKTESFAP